MAKKLKRPEYITGRLVKKILYSNKTLKMLE